MAPVPTAERPPQGLDARWLGVWRHALKTLKEQGSWAWEQAPLLAEYVYALRAADDARQGFGWLDALEAYAGEHADQLEIPDFQVLAKIAGGLPTQWDRHTKRAQALADQLLLTPRGRRAAGLGAGEDDAPLGGLEALDAATDELAPRRQRKTG
jgi:hypothetical protein